METISRKIIIFLIILAVLIGVVGYFSFRDNLYSKEIIKLEIIGPSEAEMGEEIEYLVKYKNNGDIRVDDPELIFECPDNSDIDGSIRVIKGSEEIGTSIYPGQEKTFTFRTRLLGKEGESKTAKAFLSYRPKNLKAYYESSTTLTTIIEKVPLSFDFDLPSKIESGKEIDLGLIYYSNADYSLSDLRVIVEYPSGFEFISSDPEGSEKNEWEISLLNKNQGGKINVNGKLDGEIGDKKTFRAKLGMWIRGELVTLRETSWGIEISKPSLHIIQQINGNPEYVASPGDLLHYEIFFKNIGKNDLSNLFLTVDLEGDAFDLSSIESERGEFSSGNNSIVFDWRNIPDLRLLPAQEEGAVEFWVRLQENWGSEENPPSNNVVKNRVYLSQVWRDFETKINSKLDLSQKVYFNDEIFGNSGPIPPRADQETTYTVTWELKNYYNPVKNVKVRSILPENVSLKGDVFPESEAENFAFDSDSGEVVWSLGDMESGEGIKNEAPNISFQISFEPDFSQKGKTPEIIGEAIATGEDEWTDRDLEFKADSINTTLPDDDTVSEEEGVVR